MPLDQDPFASQLGPQTAQGKELSLFASAFTGFGIYAPLEDRIRLVMNNIASNQELYGIDSSVLKANKDNKSKTSQSQV